MYICKKVIPQKTFTMKNQISLLFILLLLASSCHSTKSIKYYDKHYQSNKDYSSLSKVVELMDLTVDTSYVKSILGEPIDMGFDYRYLVDSIGSNNCLIGAVFHIDENGQIDQKWIDEICE